MAERTRSEAVTVELQTLGFLAVAAEAGETGANGAGVGRAGTLGRTFFRLRGRTEQVCFRLVCEGNLDFECVGGELDSGVGQRREVQPLHESTLGFVRPVELLF